MSNSSPIPKPPIQPYRSFTGDKAIDQALAGFSAGAVATITLHPLDLIKTRFQVDPTPRPSRQALGGTIRAFKDIIRHEGGVRSLWQGLSPNFAGATLSWGIYFWWYTHLKDGLKRYKSSERRMIGGSDVGDSGLKDHAQLSAVDHLVAAGAAGALTTLMTNPFWVCKTRMCAQKRTDPGAYTSLFDALYRIGKYEGMRGLYKGLIPALFGVSHGALQFMAYEEMKKIRLGNTPDNNGHLGTLEYIGMAASSKIFATVCTYPYQVIRSRLQNQRLDNIIYHGVIDTIRKVYAKESFSGFYKGLAPNIIRVLPGTCITFAVYEGLSKKFKESDWNLLTVWKVEESTE